MGEPTLADVTTARHDNVLPTPHYRAEYAQTMAEAFDAAANALHDMADKMRLDPNGTFAKAFQPTIIGMDPMFSAVFEIGYAPGDPPKVVVKGMARVVQAELGFRAMWTASVGHKPSTVKPLFDNSMGG